MNPLDCVRTNNENLSKLMEELKGEQYRGGKAI